MAVTIQSVLDLARIDLNDADKTRNPDATLLAYANNAIAKIKVMRPDLNWGKFNVAYTDLALTDSFPFDLQYRDAVADYIVGCAEKSDDVFAIEQRAVQAMKLFLTEIGVG